MAGQVTDTCEGIGKPLLIVSVNKFITRIHSCQSGSELLLSANSASFILITRASLSRPLYSSITSSALSLNALSVLRIIFISVRFNLLRLSNAIAFSLLFLRLLTSAIMPSMSFASLLLPSASSEIFALLEIISSAIIYIVP